MGRGINNRIYSKGERMNKQEWNRIKAIKPDDGVMAHVSKTFSAIQRPDKTIHYVPNPGRTHDIGRNKAKREARANGSRHIGKAPRVKSWRS